MNFRQFAFNNVIRNKRLYAGYFGSSAFSVMIFFVYSLLAFHPELHLTGSMGEKAQKGMDFAQYIIYIFTFFFILYSMSVFLKARKKEFGILIMHGITDIQLKRLVFLENIIIGLSATVSGILAGLIFSKGILLIGSKVLELDYTLSMYLPAKAFVLTCIAFFILFVLISFFTALVLRSNSLVTLLKGTIKPRPEPKSSSVKVVLCVFLLGSGYSLALVAKEKMVLMAMIPVTILVTIGTYLLFTQLSVFFINRLKRQKNIYWKRTNLITLSELAYRMKDNARMFFMVSIISTVAFCAIGALVGIRSLMLQGVEQQPNAAFIYTSHLGNSSEGRHVTWIEEELKREELSYNKKKISLKEQTDAQTNSMKDIIKLSDYNKIIGNDKEQVILTGNKALSLYSDSHKEEKVNTSVTLKESQKILQITDSKHETVSLSKIIGKRDVLVISDSMFRELSNSKSVEIFAFDVKKWESTIGISKKIVSKLGEIYSGEYTFESKAYNSYMIKQGIGQILFAGLFIGAVFFVSAGSFLYFRLYTDFENDKMQYKAITKLGLTEEELKKIITTQMKLLFFAPIVVAMIHGFIALLALQHAFGGELLKESSLVLGTFFIIQFVYYQFIRSRYLKQLKNNIL